MVYALFNQSHGLHLLLFNQSHGLHLLKLPHYFYGEDTENTVLKFPLIYIFKAEFQLWKLENTEVDTATTVIANWLAGPMLSGCTFA